MTENGSPVKSEGENISSESYNPRNSLSESNQSSLNNKNVSLPHLSELVSCNLAFSTTQSQSIHYQQHSVNQQSFSEHEAYNRNVAHASSSKILVVPETSNDAGSSSSHHSDKIEELISEGQKYLLEIVQQPAQARMCGFGDLDRRVIDPIPVLELFIKLENGQKIRPSEGDPLISMLMVHVALRDEFHQPLPPTDPPLPYFLVGNAAATPIFLSVNTGEVVENIANPYAPRCLIIFPDLSLRALGKYTLRFSLISFAQDFTTLPFDNPVGTVLCTVYSDVITVYRPKDFPGVFPSSELSKALAKSGGRVTVKTGRRRVSAALAASGSGASSDQKEDSNVDDNQGST